MSPLILAASMKSFSVSPPVHPERKLRILTMQQTIGKRIRAYKEKLLKKELHKKRNIK